MDDIFVNFLIFTDVTGPGEKPASQIQNLYESRYPTSYPVTGRMMIMMGTNIEDIEEVRSMAISISYRLTGLSVLFRNQ